MARNVLRTSPARGGGLARGLWAAGVLGLIQLFARAAYATEEHVSEATLKLPDLASVQFLGLNGKALLLGGLGLVRRLRRIGSRRRCAWSVV